MTKSDNSNKINPKIDDLITKIEKLTILELNEFVETLQTKFNIQPLTAIANQNASNTNQEAKSDNVNVILTEIGENKIAVIKALSSITKKGLMDAKKMLDKLPLTVMENINPTLADETKQELEKAGAAIILK